MHYIEPGIREKLEVEAKSPIFHNISNRFVDNKAVFSLIIPVLQESKILEKHLQKFPLELRKKYNFEMIVSDGGSTDDTVEIAKKYADTVIIHNSDKRQTISEGRNNGAQFAKSDVLVFLNADTIPVNIIDFLNLIIEFAKADNQYKNIDALACYVSSFPEEELLKDKIFYTLHNNYVRLLNKIGMGMGRGECQVVRKKIFDICGGYNNNIVAGEDFDLYKRISKIGNIKFEKRLHVYESPRRFRKYGYIRTITYWLINSVSVMVYNKSVSKEWEAVR